MPGPSGGGVSTSADDAQEEDATELKFPKGLLVKKNCLLYICRI